MRGKDPRRSACPDQGVPESQRIHHGGEHAHVIPGDPVEARGLKLGASHQVAAAHDHRNIRAGVRHGRNVDGRPS